MKEPLNIGVVGCGYWGPNLIRNFNSLTDARLRAICDKDAARLKHLKGLYPEAQTFTDFDAMLALPDLNAVAVATPARLHHQMATKCLLAGKHTFIEKPMASSSAECQDLVDLAHSAELTLMVGHTFLYSPPVRKIREIVTSGDVGVLRYISARRLNLGLFQTDINVVWDLAPHDISIIMFIMGESPVAVNCQGKANVTKGVEDVANMTLFFPSGGFATIHNSWLDPKKVREMTIVGTKRMVVYDDLEPLQKIKVYDVRVDAPPHYDTFAQFHYSYHYGDMYAPYIKQEEPLQVECQHFLDCIDTGAEPMTSGEQGLQLVRVLEAASESLNREGRRIEIVARRPSKRSGGRGAKS